MRAILFGSVPFLIFVVIAVMIVQPTAATTIIATAITTFVSVLGAYFLIEFFKKREQAIAEIKAINVAIFILEGAISELIDAKRELIVPTKEKLEELIDYERRKKLGILQSDEEVETGCLLVHYLEPNFDLETLNNFFMPGSIQGNRNIRIFLKLRSCFADIKTCYLYRNDFIKDLRCHPNDVRKAMLLGELMPNNTQDTRYQDTIKGLEQNVDYSLYFSKILIEELILYSTNIAKRYDLHRNKTQRISVRWKPEDQSMFPDSAKYETSMQAIENLSNETTRVF